MPQLLIELFSEEIPARMQAKAEADLGRALGEALKAAGLGFDSLVTCSGPRRLVAVVDGLPERSADVREERKGPKVGAPEQAIAGFLRGAGLSDISQASVVSDPKKGESYVALIETPGRMAAEIVAEAVPALIRGFHWPKSMRWGTGDLRWVRPLQRIVCVFDGKIVPFEVEGIRSGNETEGHRVHGRGPYEVTGWADYRKQLEGKGHVRLSREDRKTLIAEKAKAVCAKAGLELVEDEGLLDEVTGLAEWPVPVLGAMDPAFLDLPPEVIRLSMRTHQKYFAVRDLKTGALAPNFVTIANIAAADGGAKIAAGNARVLSARLADARFFWENDKANGLEAMAAKLARIEFKKELGSLAQKVERVALLARELAPAVGADPDLAERAARLCKADLVSEMVYEFPELQGVMGRYYALEVANPVIPESSQSLSGTQKVASGALGPGSPSASGMTNLLAGLEANQLEQVADAIRDHYQPLGPSNPVPTAPVSIAVALADKLDTLVGFWAINEKPTGSKDPFALRRAALGVVRIVLENGVRLGLSSTLQLHLRHHHFDAISDYFEARDSGPIPSPDVLVPDLLAFFADRLKQYLRDEGIRHDVIDAVFALGEDDLLRLSRRAYGVEKFLRSEDGDALLAGYKRAANILKAEEAKDGVTYSGAPDPKLLKEKAERDLHSALQEAVSGVDAALASEDFESAMGALASLRAPVDAFFDTVKVNADDSNVRRNRLLILAMMRDALGRVADFSKIEA